MAAPNMATITASLERSFQNCSLNNKQINSDDESSGSRVLGIRRSSSASSSTPNHNNRDHHHHRHLQNASDTTLELNSHISLPYHWEQCLDLKTGEIYYVNWRNGMKAKEDPRSSANYSSTSCTTGDYYDSTEESVEEEEEEEEESSYDSEESSSESSPNSCRRSESKYGNNNNNNKERKKKDENGEEVLVVGGCKSCFMYFMIPKHVHDCPKCFAQLLHFDRSQNTSL